MSDITPYYEDGSITIYHGDCREIVPVLDLPRTVFVLTDPPYGINWDTDYAGRGMGRATQAMTWTPVAQDVEPFDPSPWLHYPKVVLFGANHYSSRLPDAAGWIVWDKSGGGRNVNDLSDAEMAWTNVTGGVRIYSHMWKGMLKDSERRARRVHPTQKPVSLFRWILDRWAKPGDLILDPYIGSGPVLRAAKDLGLSAIGVDIVEAYCRIAADQLAQEVLPFEAV